MSIYLQRLREFLTYWYFFFPKWLWTAVILLLLILFHLWIGNVFPTFGLADDPSQETWLMRVAVFYLVGAIVVIGGGLVISLVGLLVYSIYQQLPDDPRKQKDEVTDAN